MTATQHLSISETNGQLDNLYSYDLRLGQSSQKTGMTRFCQDLAHFYESIIYATQPAGAQSTYDYLITDSLSHSGVRNQYHVALAW